MMKPAADCTTMAELRAEIDRLDAAIVTLLAERAHYIDRAAEIKPAAGLPARIGPRVDEVQANVAAHAIGLGLDPALVRRIWGVLIDWSIAREEAVLGKDLQL